MLTITLISFRRDPLRWYRQLFSQANGWLWGKPVLRLTDSRRPGVQATLYTVLQPFVYKSGKGTPWAVFRHAQDNTPKRFPFVAMGECKDVLLFDL